MQTKSAPPSQITICGLTYNEYIEKVRAFHGHVAPGVVLGGFMVDLAHRNLQQCEFFDAISETRSCLPDAIQLLTPCTVGNGWLRIIDLGRFAISLFEKYSGNGVRVYVDSSTLDNWPCLKAFFFKLVPKKEQDSEMLMREIRMANTSIFNIARVKVNLDSVHSKRRESLAVCPLCGEGYPENDGAACLDCQGKSPYLKSNASVSQKD
jgi:formylmethanofuran dehydrogenase subunit E